jgi:sugar phosphate isomerase/epimerase
MNYCYANRRHTLYPDVHDSWEPPSDAYNDGFLGKVEEIGFDGLEIGFQLLSSFDGSAEITSFGKRLSDAGTPALVVRSGGSLTVAQGHAENANKLSRMIDAAALLRANVVNGALSSPRRLPNSRNFSPGWPASQDASRDAIDLPPIALPLIISDL